jgi:AcrR family transcriptional regulator
VERDTAEKRRQIRRAAYQCFARGGYSDTTVDQVCEELGISKGSFYWHYRGKQEVFLDILETWAAEVEQQMAEQFHRAFSDGKPYLSMTEALQREARRGRHIMPLWLEFLAQSPRVKDVRETMTKFHRRIRGSIDNMLTWVLPRAFSTRDRHSLASVILAIFIGLMLQELVDPSQAKFDDTIRRFMSALKFFVEKADLTRATLTTLK